MKKAQSAGLIGTGNLTDSPLTRFCGFQNASVP